jgi:hypothetical protein
MAGVYNRKLFRQSSARDELRKLGGIMSSSEELMREAMNTAMQAPGPAARGPMGMPQRPQMGMQAPMMPMQQPMMAPAPMPMMQPQMPPMPMQQPMMPMQQPTMAQQAMGGMPFMPPQMPQSVQPRGFNEGGPILALPPAPDRSGLGGESRPRPAPKATLPYMPDLTAEIDLNPAPSAVDIGQAAGTVVAAPKVGNISAPTLDALAERLSPKLDTAPPEEVADDIVDALVEEPTGDRQFDLAKTLEEMTGDSSAYEKNIDDLNRGIIGAAIAAGTSARATENIAKGLLVGMEGAKATEERRAGDARALQLKALEVRAAEQAAREAEAKAGQAAKAEAEAKLAKEKRDLRTNTFNSVIEAGIDKLTVPEGMSIEEYARGIAEEQVLLTFPDERALAEARAALAQGADRGEVEKRLRENGIDPGRL